MRWENENANDRTSTFQFKTAMSGGIGLAALRLRAKLAHTDNPTHVPSGNRGDSDSTPAC